MKFHAVREYIPMADRNKLQRTGRIDRRKFIAGIGAGAAAGLAGCLGFGGGDGDGDGSGGDGGGGNIPTGGKPILGMDTAPNTLNVLATSTAYSFVLLDNIYTYGTYADPKTGKPIPGGFKDWTLNEENVGTGKPTIVAEMRDDLTFNDGKKVTAEDYKFTVEYIKEQEPAGSISATQFKSVEKVEVDKPKGTTVNFFLKQKDSAWLTSVVGNVFLPKHIWKNVPKYRKYRPRKEKEGIVGSGAFTLDDYSWENWFELKPREKSAIPWNKTWDFLNDGGPFVDTLRIEVFGSDTALNQAMLSGEIDQTRGTVQVEKAAQATKKESLKMKKSQDDGWAHISFNTRRVPLDDPAFRQLLVKMQDKKWTVKNLFKGIGAVKGTYATPPAYSKWRPPEPGKIKSKYEGISIPNLTFPGKVGSFNLDQSAIDKARKFLIENPAAKHNYSLGPAKTKNVKSPDNKEIYVNGKPLGQAHTDNKGAAGQGPLKMSYNPPKKSPKNGELIKTWIGALQKVGVPVAGSVTAFNSQLTQVYSKEDFDMFEMGWTGIAWNNDHYKQFYSSKGADLKGNSKAQKYNAMGYTNADDLILKQASMMAAKPRMPIVKKALARIYQDAPTNITYHNTVLQPVTKQFSDRVKVVGGVTNPFTWLNIHKSQK
jgi:peptide/nickel transport system substrate-binding protein